MRDQRFKNDDLRNSSSEVLLSILECYADKRSRDSEDLGGIEEWIVDEYEGGRESVGGSEESLSASCSLEGPESYEENSESMDEQGSEPGSVESSLCSMISRSYGTDDSVSDHWERSGVVTLALVRGEEESSHSDSSRLPTVDLSRVGNVMDPVSLEKALELEKRSIRRGELVRSADSESRVVEAFRAMPAVAMNEDVFGNVQVNRVYVDSDVCIKRQGCGDGPPKVLVKSEVDDGRGGAKTVLFDDRVARREPTSESSPDSETMEEAFRVLKEAERRAVGRDSKCPGDMQPRKFVIDQEEKYLAIEGVIKLNDLKYKNLIGKVYKKGGNGRYQYNWFTLRQSFFTCYEGKGYKAMASSAASERDGDLQDPENSTQFFKRKYTIDLLSAKVYLAPQPVRMGCIRWGSASEDDLIDITEKTKVIRVTPVKNHFIVSLKKNLVKTEVKMRTLDFALQSNGETYFYRTRDIDGFLGWLVAFAFRQGRIKCNIG